MSSTSKNSSGGEPFAPVRRRGLTINSWFLIVIFVALCIDISIRIRAWRKLQESAVQSAALSRYLQYRQQIDDQILKASAEIDRVRSAQKNHPSDSFERMIEQLKNIEERPRDPYERNIIWR